ncbi:MAG: SDR family oxidoreductase [Christiangramia sp.]|uniref:3-oxoacyl-[acyl-carrier protein] reductase n=1 Tax=Christiangramia flava JLT2011 TaxID=1229726 RepID=A0A1L7I8K5_9FLAO|nr:SDR family oxidoreductase [Christiangramia flava]APU69938.1 3-oxoacyl-[acyl-carrier protein] reductase [Christiangramia flava JLT2011]MAM19279.1 short-chain dehydrogenase [Christiangramia sp.]OSS39423.1 3-oxoacyl-[acyl-carrier protein] reductase [Christiangramia flava JLT2011]
MSDQKKTALVTGGSKGIGFGVAKTLLKMGYNVGITSRKLQAAEEAASELSEFGEVLPLEADVRSYESQQQAVEKLVNQFGSLDVLVANAGIGKFGSIEDMSPDDWNTTIDTNLTGVFYSVKASVTELKKTEGYIITISSLAGTNFFAGGAAYNASKFGLTGFSQAIMLDLRDKGVKVSTIMPGSVATYFNGNEPDDKDAWKIQIEDIGELVGDLLKMNPRTLPSKIEVRPSRPPKK